MNMKAPSFSAVAHTGSKLGSSRFLPMMFEANIVPLRPSLVIDARSSSAALSGACIGSVAIAMKRSGCALRRASRSDRSGSSQRGARAPAPDCRDRSAASPTAPAHRHRSRPCPSGGAGCRSRRAGTACRRRHSRRASTVRRRIRRDGHLGAFLGEQRRRFQRENVRVRVDRPRLVHFIP